MENLYNIVDDVRNDQSFISAGADFSLMESCGVSASNYQTESLWNINYTKPECAGKHVPNMHGKKIGTVCKCVHLCFFLSFYEYKGVWEKVFNQHLRSTHTDVSDVIRYQCAPLQAAVQACFVLYGRQI